MPEVTLGRDWESLDALSKRMWPKGSTDFGGILHALQTFEPGCQPPDDQRPTLDVFRSVVLQPVKNKEWFRGQVSLVQTLEGLRYVSVPGRIPAAASHVDQALWQSGHLGVPLDYPIDTPVGRRAVRDVLDDAIANFHLDGELEWTAPALALYLPPQRSWQNKAGMKFDFDTLARELMSRPLSETACAGTHDL